MNKILVFLTWLLGYDKLEYNSEIRWADIFTDFVNLVLTFENSAHTRLWIASLRAATLKYWHRSPSEYIKPHRMYGSSPTLTITCILYCTSNTVIYRSKYKVVLEFVARLENMQTYVYQWRLPRMHPRFSEISNIHAHQIYPTQSNIFCTQVSMNVDAQLITSHEIYMHNFSIDLH